MNYPQNTKHWNIGSLVLHEADAKEPRMLMRVIGYRADGFCETEYLDKKLCETWGKGRHHGRIFNPVASLHDPELFGVKAQAPA